MKKTNFDRDLEEQLKDPQFAARFKQAGEAWDLALQLADLRKRAGLSQAALARRLKTSQQICRLESPRYFGHSMRMLRRVAKALNAHVRVILEPNSESKDSVTGLKTFKAGLDEMVKFAQGKKAKVKIETLVINSKGHDGEKSRKALHAASR
jgi:transcriptional regulator with XRE-family HTH domain